MKTYKSVITLNKNERGIWDLDPSKGCASGYGNGNGCYDDCYAARKARIYGYDFSRTVLRDFTSLRHQRQIIQQINRIDMPFIRMGCSGDPSENWEHTLNILEKIKSCNKEIVIITKHWTTLDPGRIAKYNVCINTSVSALDETRLDHCLEQYERLKPYCRSVLRVVSCDFADERLAEIQRRLFRYPGVIDTVFRPTLQNPLVTSGTVNVKRMKFMNSVQILSKFNKKTFIGKCSACSEQCGVYNDQLRQTNIGKQLNLF